MDGSYCTRGRGPSSLTSHATARMRGVRVEDEADIDLNPKIGSDWMLPGTQRRVMTLLRRRH